MPDEPITYLVSGILAVAFSGWTITGWVVRLIIVGRLVPGKLMDAKDAELNATKEDLQESRQQANVLLSETVGPLNTLLDILRRNAPQDRS